jgi:hypothetical protein
MNSSQIKQKNLYRIKYIYYFNLNKRYFIVSFVWKMNNIIILWVGVSISIILVLNVLILNMNVLHVRRKWVNKKWMNIISLFVIMLVINGEYHWSIMKEL